MTDPIALAAWNNAEWCDAVSRAHRAACRFEAGFWINAGDAPPFYPNLVTTDPHATAPQLKAIELLTEQPGRGTGIKDSFFRLDLSEIGLKPLFEADWLWLPSAAVLPASNVEVTAVAGADELALWEQAWGGTDGGDRVFPPKLLGNERIRFLAARREGRIVAGAAVNHSNGAVGISNVFHGGDAAALAALVSTARGRSPDLPVVGYESGEDRAPFHAVGFASIGKLRVWTRA
ncbi:MAG TPA: hypothetical protein VNX29_12960 [Kaistia sp.]|nr:hypothetical protein [Kaistia sp.]